MARLKRRDPVILAELLSELIQSRVDEIPVDLELDSQPRVTGRARALALAVDNLIDNAIAATPPGGHVRVRLDSDRRGALIDVIDEGRGLSRGARALLFEPFAGNDERGLGLAATDAIVRAHGGSVEHYGPPTTFRVRLPLSG